MITLSNIQLKLYSDEEVRKLAVVQVLNPSTYDRGLPKANGVNDARMGVTDKALQCPTCGLTSTCNNHYGYIELEKPVIRVGHIASVLCILRSVCWACSRPKFSNKKLPNFADVRMILNKTTIGSKERLRAISEACKNKLKCPYEDCGVPQPQYTRVNKLFFDRKFREKDKELFLCEEEYLFATKRLFPDEIKSIIHNIPAEALLLMGYNQINHPENYIMKAHLVPPPSIRPATSAGSTEARLRGENDLTVSLQEIVRTNNELATYIASGNEKDIHFGWDKLQIFCGALINQNLKKLLTFDGHSVLHARAIGKRNIKDLKKRLTGKKGRLRGNLSGKRVDHSGRSVVGPDASHDIFQLGVPVSILNTLTFPETVNNLNMKRLSSCIIKGANTYGGALTVRMQQNNEEKVLHTSLLDEEGRKRLASSLQCGFIVERHLVEDDWVLFNRQPSLHKASIMAFQCYPVRGSQFKLPLPCTKPFNADFDGDEMNLHALQDYTAIAEAQEIMSVPHQMVTPQSNSVLISLVQDSIVGAYMMTRKDSFCDYHEIMQLSMCIHYSTTSDDYLVQPSKKSRSFADDFTGFPQPAILKSKHGPLWTGKQIFGLLLPNNLSVIKAVNNANFKNVNDILNDDVVIVRKGILMSGRLCKQSVGNSGNGIVQAMWKQQSPWAASKFISDAQRLLMQWLKKDTICISIRDCVTDADSVVDDIVIDAMKKNYNIENTDVPVEVKEIKQTQIMQDTLKNAGGEVLKRMNHNSGVANVVASGAKGNVMNIAQIGGLVGQQTINGARIAFRKGPIGKRTLANFAPNDNSPQARGFVSTSYLMGLNPSEFFFHQQAGREGVVATAVSTADTGYNQRRMIKNQESEVVSYDLSVRVSSNLIVQMHYGGDDYDGTFVERVKIPKDAETNCRVAFEILKNREEVSMPTNIERLIACTMIQEDILDDDMAKPFDLLKHLFDFMIHVHDRRCNEQYETIEEYILRPLRDKIIFDDPSLLARCMLSLQVSEQFLNNWKVKKSNIPKIVEEFKKVYARAIVNPGEGVGAVGSSSIGEPSTQMTLNIFHYSGIAEKNVTLTGLPRFKQIINAVDTYDTANMQIRLHEKLDKFQLRSFAARLAKCTLNDIISSSYVYQSNEKKELVEIIDQLTLPEQKSTWIARFNLDKNKTYSKYLNVEDVGENLNAYLENAHVTWTSNFSDEWIILVRPPVFCEDDSFDRIATETVHDSLLDIGLINGFEYIRKALPVNDFIETEGSDLLSIAQIPEVDPLKTCTNNIIETMNLLGVEAALSLMQSELHRVLSFDGSYVDPRHTWLLADTVGRSGNINPLNRHKMEELGGSLLQCASFEQTLEVFEHGAAFGKTDYLGGATEKLILGQPVHVGTGSFGIIGDIQNNYTYEVIPPLERNKNDHSSYIEPLKEKIYDENSSSSLSIHEPKTYEEHTFLELFSFMRKMAHRREQIWIIGEIIDLNEVKYNKIEKYLNSYLGWNEKPEYMLTTVVEYIVNEETIISEKNEHKKIEHQLVLEDQYKDEKIIARAESRVYYDNEFMPVAVEPKTVIYKQSKTYRKSEWDIVLTKSYSADTFLEVERLIDDTKNCVYRVNVILEKPWDLLEKRGSTDVFMMNMFLNKLYNIIDKVSLYENY